MKERRGRDDFRVLSPDDGRSNGIVSRSGTQKREVLSGGGQTKLCLKTSLFPLVTSPWQKQDTLCFPCGSRRAVVETTLAGAWAWHLDNNL